MKNINKLLVLSSSFLLLASCSVANQAQGSEGSGSASENGDSSSDAPVSKWGASNEALLKKYCGEVLPYPSCFNPNEVTLEEVQDSSTGLYTLDILWENDELEIADYYKDLEKAGWEAIKDYNGSVEQLDSEGGTFVEAVKIGEDGKTGYELAYYLYEASETYEGEEITTFYNVIQCCNFFSSALDGKTSWDEEEKSTLNQVLTELPPLLKMGEVNVMNATGSDYLVCHDLYAKDLSKENVEILKNNGYVLDKAQSEAKGSYILKKELSDGSGATLYASLYYASGNYIAFTYEAKKEQSASWPKEFVSAFESKTGFSVPSFEASVYYTYSKAGVYTIYGYTDTTAVTGTFAIAMDRTSAILDHEKNWYTDWAETFYIKPTSGHDANGNFAFSISFGYLASSYDSIEEGWPSSSIASFLNESSIGASCPTLDYSSVSAYSSCRVAKQDYADMYAKCLAAIQGDPANYVGKESPTEEEIEATATAMAKARTWMKIKIYDLGITVGNDTLFRANDYLIEAFRKQGWSKVDSEEGAAYEDPTGALKATISLDKDISVLTLSYGSGKTHTPVFAFDETNVELSAGSAYNLQYTADMLPYDITFSSDSSKVTVDSKGSVSVAEDAVPGSQATITATMVTPEGETKTITCTITIIGSFTALTAAESVASSYNSYFNLSENDDGYAKTAANGEESVYYTIVSSLSSFSTLSEAKTFVISNLVPQGFSASSAWGNGVLPDGTETNFIIYSIYDNKTTTTVNLTFAIYEDSEGKFALKVTATQF